MADYYFHYTSTVAAQMIIVAGWIAPGAGGVVFLTDESYATASEAADRLGIPVIGPVLSTPSMLVSLTKAIEAICVIPAARLPLLSSVQPVRAVPFRDSQTGRVIYSGGGREFQYPGHVNVQGLTWLKPGSL